jgi:CheY-like chemotaxis protein
VFTFEQPRIIGCCIVAEVYQWVCGIGSEEIIHGDLAHRLVIGSRPNLFHRERRELNARLEMDVCLSKRQVANCEVEMKAMASESVARKRILCVDDDKDTREMMNALLDHYGYEPVIAASVSDALQSAKSGGLALCILDHWFTESNGIELCQKIRAFDPDTPIMFYSGAGYGSDIQKGLDAGAQAYLIKPDFDHLKPTIDRLIYETDPTTHLSLQ